MRLPPLRFRRTVLRPFLFAATWLALASSAAAEWVQLVTPSCTIVSEVSASRTRAWAMEFERFRSAISQLLLIDDRRLDRVSVVLFASDRRFRPFKPVEQGRPAEVGGYFLRAPGRNLIALNVDGARDDTRERIFHEATHWYLSALDQPPPLWLNEGLAEFFGTFRPGGDTFTVGASRVGWISYLRSFPPIPFAKLAAVLEGTLHYNGPHSEQTEHFYAQAWATTHFLLLGGDRHALLRLRGYLWNPRPAGDAAQIAGAFGRTPAEIDAQLPDYLWKKQWLQYSAAFQRKVDGRQFTVKPAPAGEVDLALGNLLIGVGRPADAAAYLRRAAQALPADPRPPASLGEVELAAGRLDSALARFQESFARGGSTFAGHYLAAVAGIRELDQVAGPAADAAGLRVIEHLATALKLNPRSEESYVLLGMLAAFVPATEAARIGTLLLEGQWRYPAEPAISLGLAFTALQQGHAAEARSYRASASLVDLAPNSPLRDLRRQFDERLSRTAPTER